MLPRVDHNLVLLPTGDVMVLGGMRDATNVNTAVRTPQIWSPATDQWSDTLQLAPDPAFRDYHSTAILLPDGRILSGGGDIRAFPTDRNRYTGTIYWPPYLFDSSGAPAPKPQIDSLETALTYGAAFTVTSPDAAAIQSVCLIRPASTTHGVDEEQRYVPLAFTPETQPSRLEVTAPAGGTWAPPGRYLLFIVNADSVPSVGQWVSLTSGQSGGLPRPDRPPLLAAYPNPFSERATVQFQIPAPGHVSVRALDALGRSIRRIHEGPLEAGFHSRNWDGRDEKGRTVPAGVYYITLRSPGLDRTVKLVSR
jgi:hypothetical protein